jgi:hypothetical protein
VPEQLVRAIAGLKLLLPSHAAASALGQLHLGC